MSKISKFLENELDRVNDYLGMAKANLIVATELCQDKCEKITNKLTEEDFKIVIDKKYEAWHDDKDMAQYLRPETLFSNKFESYLNQPIITKEKTIKDISMKEIDMALARESEQKGKEANDDNIRIY